MLNKLKKILFVLALFFSSHSFSQVRNFMFVGMDRDQLKDTGSWASDLFEGVQVAYSWRQLERQKDVYDFGLIDEDLKLLQKHGKKLFIQLQDASFSIKWNNTPRYLLEDTIYHGGANKQYEFRNNDESEASEAGWATRRWDIHVQERLQRLFIALGKRYDGVIEGINTQETSVTFGSGPLHPPGFSYQRYKDALIENLTALKKAFPKSTVIVYANFMPGGYIPGEDTTLLKAIYQFAWRNNVGVGGPDLLPYKRGQMKNSYGLIKDSYRKVVSGVAVQDGTGEYINPVTNKSITAEEIYRFAETYLHLTYIFWGTEDPFFHANIIPFLRSIRPKLN